MYYYESSHVACQANAVRCSFLAPLTFNYPWLAISQVTDFVTNNSTTTTTTHDSHLKKRQHARGLWM